MNICKTCKHWETGNYLYAEGVGVCAIAEGVSEEDLFWIESSYCESLAMLTKENFGCVAWEGKEDEPR